MRVSWKSQEAASAGSPPQLSHRLLGACDHLGWAWPHREQHQTPIFSTYSPAAQEGLTLFARPENYYFLSSKTQPQEAKSEREEISVNSHMENTEKGEFGASLT